MVLERYPGAALASGSRLRRAGAVLHFFGRFRSVLTAVRVGTSIVRLNAADSGGRTALMRANESRDQSREKAPIDATPPIARTLSNVRAATPSAKWLSRAVSRARLEDAPATPRSHIDRSAAEPTERPVERLPRSPRVLGVPANQLAAPKRLSQLSLRTTFALEKRARRSEGTTRFHRASQAMSYSSVSALTSPLRTTMFQANLVGGPISEAQPLVQSLSGPSAFIRSLTAKAESHAIRHISLPAGGRLDNTLVRRTRSGAPSSRTAPALAAVSSRRRGAEPPHAASLASLVINSTPTVVIHADGTSDIEGRVLEVLRQHREMLFDQWQREAQRRQRTEF